MDDTDACTTCRKPLTSHCFSIYQHGPEGQGRRLGCYCTRECLYSHVAACFVAFGMAPAHPIETVCREMRDFLLAKNARYGNSALKPLRVFSKSDAREQLRVRIDDKLNRLMQGGDDDEDTVWDLAGYLLLYLADRGENTSDGEAQSDVE